MICRVLKSRAAEASALRRGDLKLVSREASNNDLLDRTTLAGLERVDPPPVPATEWHSFLSAAHRIESEQEQLAEKAQAGDLPAVRSLARMKSARRTKLAQIADATQLAPCRGFI